MILPSINYLNESKVFYLSYLYGGISRSFSMFFFLFSMSLDNMWYARVEIFKIEHNIATSPNVRYCYDVNFFHESY